MAFEQPGFSSSFVAGEDLSAKQYYYVKTGTTEGEIVACAATTDKPVGVLQNSPASGQEALVMHVGITKISSDAALAYGNKIGTSADGQAAVYAAGSDTTKYINGEVLAASSAAGELATAAINCLGVARGA